jgi:hypothetical protein
MRYVIVESWRFELEIKPYMVYAARQVDEVLEREMSWIDKYIDWNNLLPRIWKLGGGKDNLWRRHFDEAPRYKNELENKPRYTSTEEHLDH